jgi:Helix-turn-helix domain
MPRNVKGANTARPLAPSTNDRPASSIDSEHANAGADRQARLAAKLKLLTDACGAGEISDHEFRVLGSLLLQFHNNDSGRCFPSDATLAEAIGKGERMTSQLTRDLADKGWLKKKRSQGGPSNYSFPDVPDRQSVADLRKSDRQSGASRSAMQRHSDRQSDCRTEPLKEPLKEPKERLPGKEARSSPIISEAERAANVARMDELLANLKKVKRA